MIERIEKIERHIGQMTLEEFAHDEKTLDLAVLGLQVIGDASALVPKEIQAKYPHIPWREMKSFRNFLVHQYFRVDPAIVWSTFHDEVKPLKHPLNKILEAEHGE
jgi:uncharacterized protein with HEPN domain